MFYRQVECSKLDTQNKAMGVINSVIVASVYIGDFRPLQSSNFQTKVDQSSFSIICLPILLVRSDRNMIGGLFKLLLSKSLVCQFVILGFQTSTLFYCVKSLTSYVLHKHFTHMFKFTRALTLTHSYEYKCLCPIICVKFM